MSWKITKSMFSWSPNPPPNFPLFRGSQTNLTVSINQELKETHLAPLTQSFTRSSSTSTIKPESGEETPAASQTPRLSSDTSNNGIGMFLSPVLETGVSNVSRSCLGITRLSPRGTRQPRHPDCYSPRRPQLLSATALPTGLQLSRPERLWGAAQFLVLSLRTWTSRFICAKQPSSVNKLRHQRCSDYPRSVLDQIPSLCATGFRKKSSLRRCSFRNTGKPVVGWRQYCIQVRCVS